MKALYPLKFYPILKDKIWGGQKMKTVANIDFEPLPNCGEAWLISGMERNETVVSNGWLEGNALDELLEIYMSDLVGDDCYTEYGERFPLLLKLIDAADELSIQVHPDNDLAKERGLESGKTEMWYVMQSDPGANLISGFKHKINIEDFVPIVRDNALIKTLNIEEVNKGDVFYIPGKRIHSIGKGVFLAEIQQSSDTTYRVYDWDRVDDKGNGRELHLDEAIDSLDFQVHASYRTEYKTKLNETSPVVKAPFFVTNILSFNKVVKKDFSEMDCFVIYLCVEGSLEVVYDEGVETLKCGEAILIPAVMKSITLNPVDKPKLLEIYLP